MREQHLALPGPNGYTVSGYLQTLYPGCRIEAFPAVTRGNLETALLASVTLPDQELWVLDADNRYQAPDLCRDFQARGWARHRTAGVCWFETQDTGNHWARVQVRDGTVTRIGEKDPELLALGGKPLVGTFYFRSTALFRNAAHQILDRA